MSTFVSRDAASARAALATFIEMYRTLGAFGLGEAPFEADAWQADGLLSKGRKGYIYFGRSSYTPRRHFPQGHFGKGMPADIPEADRMPPLFRDFAKAMISHLHLTDQSTQIVTRVYALQALLDVLDTSGNGDPDPTDISVADLDKVCDSLRDSELGQDARAQRGNEIATIWRAMVNLELVQAPSQWVNPLKAPPVNSVMLGPEFDALRQKKLPDPRALEACADLFNRDDLDCRTTFASSYVALAMCAPERNVEFRYAPADLLTPWTDPESGQEGVCLRWFPAKGGLPQTKNLDLEMSPIARRAHDRLKKLTEPARKLAHWYEDHPTSLYLEPQLECLRGNEALTLGGAFAVLYGGEVKSIDNTRSSPIAKFFERHGVAVKGAKGSKTRTVAFSDLERAVLGMLPKGFPIMDPETGMKYSEALCLLRSGEFSGYKYCMPGMLQAVTYGMLSGALGNVKKTASIFDQAGLTAPDGSRLYLKTHAMRHYLNTIVRRLPRKEGLSRLTEDEIAWWSGRWRVEQNKTYNHQSRSDQMHELEVMLGFHSDTRPFEDISRRIFIKRDQFGQIEKITAHITDIGYCLHDYVQAPCPIAKNCIQCNESMCIKGNERSIKALEFQYGESHMLTLAAQRDRDEGIEEASDWFKAHLEREAMLKNLLDIHHNPDIPDGTPIFLNVDMPNRIKESMARRTIPIKPVAEGIKSLEDVTRLLAPPTNPGIGAADAN